MPVCVSDSAPVSFNCCLFLAPRLDWAPGDAKGAIMVLNEKVYCPRCEEERWVRPMPGGYKCGVCLHFIPAEVVQAYDHEEEERGH